MSASAHVVIVGAGVAGSSAAYYAAQAGWKVTVVDARRERASDVPVALVNPVRGTNGKLVEGGFEATRFTFSLIDVLLRQGFEIPQGRGVVRPVPDAATRSRWQQNLPPGEAWRWIEIEPSFNLVGDWHSALLLPEAGWIETRPLLDALITASGCELVHGEVAGIEATRLLLSDGRAIAYQRLLWCGGGLGAGLTTDQISLGAHKFRPGSVLLLDRPLASAALSYGIYAAPFGTQGVVGSTSEPPSAAYSAAENAQVLSRLEKRVASTFKRVGASVSHFRGVRFERLKQSDRLTTLDGFGSRGYLLAPLAAHSWAESLPHA